MPHSSFASLIRYQAMITPYIILLKDGCLMSGCKYTRVDMDTAPEHVRASIAGMVNNAIKRLGQDYMLHFEVVRVPTTEYPEGNFSETVTALIDHERKKQFQRDGSHYETETYFFLTWQPPLVEKNSFMKKLLNLFITGDNCTGEIATDKQIQNFEAAYNEFINSLETVFSLEPLRDEKLLSSINLCVNGRHTGSVYPDTPDELDALFARDAQIGDPLVYNNEYLGIVSIDGFPSESFPCILERLSAMPYIFRWSTRYIPMDFRVAYAHMSKEQRKWAQKKLPMLAQLFNKPTTKVNKDALIQEEDVNDALQGLNEGIVSYGHYTCVIVLRAQNIYELEAAVRETARTLEEILFTARIEHRNTLEAFLGSLPGHGYENVRKPLLHSLNLSHMLELGSVWSGELECPCPPPFYPPHSPALIQATSASGSPFRLHLHHGDVGHTLILGPTGAGKSTLLALIAAQYDRYPKSQLFIFDKGRSMYALIQAMEQAVYYDLGSEHSPSLCPLSCLDTRSDRTWALEYVEMLVELNKCDVTPSNRAQIENAILSMSKGTTTSDERTLSALQINIQDDEIRDALNIYTYNGAYGQYLDGATTEITYSKTNAYELEDLMTHAPQVVTPTLIYLFHEIEKRLDGRPTLIIIDEAWLALSTPLFAAKLKEWLKVLRKANAAVVLATQSLVDVINSDISDAVLDSCPTKILLPNAEANSDSMRSLYAKQLMLNDAEIDTIASSVPKQDYFFANPYGRRLFRLALGDASLSFVGASGAENIKKIAELKARYGTDWPSIWLKERRLPEWSEYWYKIKEQMHEVSSNE